MNTINRYLMLNVVALFLALSVTNVSAQIAITDGLAGYWSFDKETIVGDTIKDIWGANHGEIEGAPKTVQGKVKDGMEFGGEEDQILVPHSESLNITDGITLCAWIFWNGSTGIVASKRDPVSYQFSAIDDNTIQLCAPDCLYSEPVLSANEWIHIAAVRQENTVLFYKDGEPVGTSDQATAWVMNEVDLIIGAWPGKGYKYGGILDELSIYNRPLDEDEIKRNFIAKGLAVDFYAKLASSWGDIKSIKQPK